MGPVPSAFLSFRTMARSLRSTTRLSTWPTSCKDFLGWGIGRCIMMDMGDVFVRRVLCFSEFLYVF